VSRTVAFTDASGTLMQPHPGHPTNVFIPEQWPRLALNGRKINMDGRWRDIRYFCSPH